MGGQAHEWWETAHYIPCGIGQHPQLRGFHCHHAHCEGKKTQAFLDWVAEQGGPDVKMDMSGEFAEANRRAIVEKLRERMQAHPEAPGTSAGDPAVDEDPDEAFQELRELLPDWKGRKAELPDCAWLKPNSNGESHPSSAQKPTRANVQWIVNELGIRCRFDMMRKDLEMAFTDPVLQHLAGPSKATKRDNLLRSVIDAALCLGIDAEKKIERIVTEMCRERPFHPVQEWIEAVKWDGVSRFDQLAASVEVAPDYASIWPIYLRRWLIQGVQAWCGWRDPKQISSVLVLAGEQGILETTWLTHLLPREFTQDDVRLDSRSSSGEKDGIMTATTRALTEFGELEVTFKQTEQGTLKGFLSRTEDRFQSRMVLEYATGSDAPSSLAA